MRRATTPTHTFTFPEEVPVTEISDATITYSQNGETILEKTLGNLVVDAGENQLALTMTMDETNLFAPGKALVQVRAKTNGAALASQMIWLQVKPVLDSGGF